MAVVQINLWPGFGGSEVYTRFTAEALSRLGHESILFVNQHATYWETMQLGETKVFPVAGDSAVVEALASPRFERSTVLIHSPLAKDLGARLAPRACVVGFVHQPMRYLNREPYRQCHYLACVSEHVRRSVLEEGFTNCYPEPVYGVADLHRLKQRRVDRPVTATSVYEYDERKLRDKLLRRVIPLAERLLATRTYEKRRGLTLGIVSRLVTIKGFPELFAILAPRIARHRDVHLEIFGSGGLSYIRKLKKALHPIRDRTRFWGPQRDILAVYSGLDCLLTGFPEREGLPLNVLEAQAAGVPVLAPDAPPFSEAIKDGSTGILYRDPRTDDGHDFAQRLDQLVRQYKTSSLPDPRTAAPEHLAGFTIEAFAGRLAKLLQFVRPSS